ncbi:MAG: response regulator [Candidatus Dormibacteria bacterium]
MCANPASGEPLEIVLAEDNPDIALLNRRVLEAEGHSVHVASDGASTVDAVRDTAPDLLLLDVEMPRLNGPEVVEQLRTDPSTTDQAVVMMTNGEMTHEQEVKMRRLGVLDILAKYRFTPRVLADWIRRWRSGKTRDFPANGKRL